MSLTTADAVSFPLGPHILRNILQLRNALLVFIPHPKRI